MKLEDVIRSAAGGCQTPGCTHANHAGPMYLHGRCHPKGATFAVIDGGKLRIECAVCKKPVAEIEP